MVEANATESPPPRGHSLLPVFLSVVVVTRNQESSLGNALRELSAFLSALLADHEIIVVDNASSDGSVRRLRDLARDDGLPNLQAYALTKEVDPETATWAGVENALGDYVAIFDPRIDSLEVLPGMLDLAISGSDIVLAYNTARRPQTWPYRLGFSTFNAAYRWATGLDLAREAPNYRVVSKRVVTYLMQHAQPALAYRHLPVGGGFPRETIVYTAPVLAASPRSLRGGIERGIRLLISSTRMPMRIVTVLSLFGALANVVYSLYVVAVALLKADVAPGWTSISLQQSGMFFLISLVLFVLGEYILNMVRLSSDGPAYHVGQEFMSSRITRRDRLNVESVAHRTGR